jgi:DNA-binding response OmpR family regulator
MSQQAILILEDNAEMQMLIRAILSSKFHLTFASNTKEAYGELRSKSYDLIILDVGLPGESGFQFCANIKLDLKLRQVPVIFLTSFAQTAGIVMGFSLGADDYISKPIDCVQFEARICAKLRNQIDSKKKNSTLVGGQIKIDLDRHKVFVSINSQQSEIAITAIEFKLFKYFIERNGHVISREQILNDVWGHKLSITDRTVDSHVYTLRKKLGDLAGQILTVSGVGYQFQEFVASKGA